MENENTTLDCGHSPSKHEACTTGYGKDNNGKTYCYDCCAKQDKQSMIDTGKAVLYLTCEPAHKVKSPEGRKTKGTISNWPGSLSFEAHTSVGHHNIVRWRYDAWFIGPDGYRWHGVQYGDNTQIIHCRRTKEKIEEYDND